MQLFIIYFSIYTFSYIEFYSVRMYLIFSTGGEYAMFKIKTSSSRNIQYIFWLFHKHFYKLAFKHNKKFLSLSILIKFKAYMKISNLSEMHLRKYCSFFSENIVERCSQTCQNDLLCKSWTWYNSGPYANTCFINYENQE